MLTGLLLACLVGCGGSPADTQPVAAGPDGPSPPFLVEITEAVGLAGLPGALSDGTYYLPEIMGPGVGLFDHDSDGDLDILQPRVPTPGKIGEPAPNRLLDQQEDGTFRDVTERSGLGDPGFGQGLAVGDVDGDGHPDVYFCNLGRDALYRNRGDGTFVDVTDQAGISDDLWSTGATFCDYDRDGHLDLYVAHYLRIDYHRPCKDPAGAPDFCGPASFDGVADKLYHNDGDGSFTDVSSESGIDLPRLRLRAKGLGVVCLDLTGDDWPDFYVANDGEANQLWVNGRDGQFTDQALTRGTAVNRHGRAEASMGLAVGDLHRDGTPDLFMTHLGLENNTLFVSSGRTFMDRTVESRLPSFDLQETGFGCGFFDLEHDGDLDLAVVNGAVRGVAPRATPEGGGYWARYGERNMLLTNDGASGFTDAGERAEEFTRALEVSRGLAFGDLDGDGDLDLVLSNVDNTLRAFRNDAPEPGSHWLLVRALTGSRHAIGARVRVVLGDGTTYTGWALRGYSYQSSNDPRVHFGLGVRDDVVRVEVLWPDGMQEAFGIDAVDREIVLRQGHGAKA